jgi:hypothetical protein
MSSQNRPARFHLLDTIHEHTAGIQHQGLQQNQTLNGGAITVNDPTHATGDPNNNYATYVMGNLFPVCGIAAYGAAVWHHGSPGSWVQIAPV